ncbi:hypothetical protein ACLKA7_004885 [Drosophila subpalustris]
MKQELIHTFGHRVTAWDIGKQLEARKIKKGESALQYFVAMCSIAMQAELATSDVIQFIVHGLQDKLGAAASMMYCTSLDELREKLSYTTSPTGALSCCESCCRIRAYFGVQRHQGLSNLEK